MPETYIVYRSVFEEEKNLGYTKYWSRDFDIISKSPHWDEAKEIIESSDFSNIEERTVNPVIREFLRHYHIQRSTLKNEDKEYNALKKQYDNLIKSDRFIDLTLTYDYV